MTHVEILLQEFKSEVASTRRLLACVPMDKADWKPHEKSMTLGRLATHIAEMYGWFKVTIEESELDFSKNGGASPQPADTDALVAFFHEKAAEAEAAMNALTEEIMIQNWSLRNGEQVYFTMPKAAVLRTFCMNHVYHHRGQLSVYLRLLNVPVPGLYGPSADDRTMG